MLRLTCRKLHVLYSVRGGGKLLLQSTDFVDKYITQFCNIENPGELFSK